MKYKLVLFDADGTLFDFDTAEKQAFEKTFKQFGIDKNLRQLHKEYEIINMAIWRDFEQKKITSEKLRIEPVLIEGSIEPERTTNDLKLPGIRKRGEKLRATIETKRITPRYLKIGINFFAQ